MRSGSATILSRLLGLAAVLAVTFQLSGCGSVLSRKAMDQVNPNLSPDIVLKNPKAFIGQTVLVGGTILSSENLQEGTLVEVLTYPTDRRGNPQLDEPALGRFLLLYPGYLDTLIYQQGRKVVAAGRIIGERVTDTGETNRAFPLLHPLEIELLSEYDTGPRFGIGLGFQFGF
ncbi:Slp family lipoprotein [Methylocaldum sp.]|uniref:Slp family lipoprotein n=1 Tax=Methylocaldum sp. TaxID=1969727 RepID=UPI002D30617B|nr:Slp family lipoprotein [Methylocaldum sp.]HYE38108.1 Slp family lipoprotein [Methylocaldum sp.]